MKKRTTIRRVDEKALRAILKTCQGTAAEVILRLAWGTGLTPEEMHELVWSDVDFEAGVIHLPDRSVPADGETMRCLRERYEQPFSRRSEYAILSDQRKVHMNRVYIFRYARDALMRGGLENVTLMGLRNDFILRQLEQYSKAHVARIAGVTLATLDGAFIKEGVSACGNVSTEQAECSAVDEARLAEAVLAERDSPAGLAIRMTWKCGLRMKEIVALTWDEIHLEAREIALQDRLIPMDRELGDLLNELRSKRAPEDDPHVVLTPQSRRPYDGPHLSRVVKDALIRAGLDGVTLRDLYLKGQRERQADLLLRYAGARGFVTREETMKLFQTGWRPAWDLLHRLVQEERLVRIGARYYLPGTAVPPEQHFEVVRAYLETEGGAYRKELAQLLRIEEKQCGWILSGLVAEGKLAREGQRYVLPEEAAYQFR